MEYGRRLKPDRSIAGFIPAMAVLLIFGLILTFYGINRAMLAVALFFIAYAAFSAWIFLKTRNQSYIAAALFQLAFGLYLATNPRFTLLPEITQAFSSLFLILIIASTIWLFYLFFTRRAKWKGREVFELASVSIGPVPDGFTGRPHPVGKAEYSREELSGFAAFLRKNLVAMPYYEENGIILVPVKIGDEFNYIFRPAKFRSERSWISFGFDGTVSVNISRKDYIDYRDELSFDQLCENMGNLFIRFIRYYCKSEPDRILYDLDRLGLGVTS